MTTITFYCDNQQVSSIANLLNNIYTLDGLERIRSKTIRPVIDYQNVMVERVDADGTLRIDLNRWLTHSTSRKQTLLSIVSLILSDKRNFDTWLSLQPPGMQQLWKKVMNNLMVEYREADQLTGNKSSERNERFFSSYRLEKRIHELYPWFDTIVVRENFDFSVYLMLHRKVYSLVAKLMMPPSTSDYFATDRIERVIFNAEADSLLHVPAVKTLFAQGILAIGKTKMLMKNTIKKLADMHMAQLPILATIAEPNLREQALGLLVAIAFSHLGSKTKRFDVDAPALIKLLASEMQYGGKDLFVFVTSFLDGIKYTETCNTCVNWMLRLLCEMLTMAPDEWIDVDALLPIGVRLLGDNVYAMLGCDIPDYGLTYRNRNTEVVVTTANLVHEVGLPMLRGLIVTLASVGLVELAAVSGKQPPASTPFDLFGAFRLTALGRYVYGVDDEYVPQHTDDSASGPEFEASATHLLVRALNPNSPYMQILRSMATHVGNNRWAFTSKSFLDGCTSLNDVNRQIGIFKQYICAEPTPVWLDFFEALKQQVQPLKSESLTHYRLYSVDPSNSRLLQLLDSDQRLRQLILRVDGHRLLVHSDDYQRFAARLKELGYLI